MTKRFANPARSRATRGRENAWLEAPTSSSAWPTRTTKQDDRYDDAFTPLPSPARSWGDRFLRPTSFSPPIFRAISSKRRETRRGRRSLDSVVLGSIVTSAMRWVSVPRPQRYRSAVRHGSTANRQLRPRAPSLPLLGCGSLDRSRHTLARVHRTHPLGSDGGWMGGESKAIREGKTRSSVIRPIRFGICGAGEGGGATGLRRAKFVGPLRRSGRKRARQVQPGNCKRLIFNYNLAARRGGAGLSSTSNPRRLSASMGSRDPLGNKIIP